jgi:hypothetical protein
LNFGEKTDVSTSMQISVGEVAMEEIAIRILGPCPEGGVSKGFISEPAFPAK